MSFGYEIIVSRVRGFGRVHRTRTMRAGAIFGTSGSGATSCDRADTGKVPAAPLDLLNSTTYLLDNGSSHHRTLRNVMHWKCSTYAPLEWPHWNGFTTMASLELLHGGGGGGDGGPAKGDVVHDGGLDREEMEGGLEGGGVSVEVDGGLWPARVQRRWVRSRVA